MGRKDEVNMKSYLIKDTTKQERIELIRQWVPADEAMQRFFRGGLVYYTCLYGCTVIVL